MVLEGDRHLGIPDMFFNLDRNVQGFRRLDHPVAGHAVGEDGQGFQPITQVGSFVLFPARDLLFLGCIQACSLELGADRRFLDLNFAILFSGANFGNQGPSP